MGRKYFGTDGIRGLVGKDPITPERMLQLGFAAGRVLANNSEISHPTVLIGKDTRISGYLLEAALEAGFAAAGVDVVMTGPIPTPAVAYLTRALRMSAGVVISASHNPFQDNGIKFFSALGNKLPDDVELKIEAEMDQPLVCAAPDKLGKVRRLDDAAGRYIEFCKSSFPSNISLHGLKIVLDCANGAAYETAPAVFHELGAEVIRIHAQPNGTNINHHCGATHTDSLVEAVKSTGADLGIALDGDADRVMMVDSSGRVYNGDELLYIMVKDRMTSEYVPGVVGTLMTNLALEQAFRQFGIGFARAKVGDRYVLETLQQKGWRYGGESSGHLLALDCHSTGDGTISALQVLRAIKQQKKSLAELVSDLVMFPQTLINVKIAKDAPWEDNATFKGMHKQVEAELGDSGRVLIRASGTEPLVRVMVEARDANVARKAAERIADTLRV
jgi:phosphoglucosamine mutase